MNVFSVSTYNTSHYCCYQDKNSSGKRERRDQVGKSIVGAGDDDGGGYGDAIVVGASELLSCNNKGSRQYSLTQWYFFHLYVCLFALFLPEKQMGRNREKKGW